jgi:hypothetical protein
LVSVALGHTNDGIAVRGVLPEVVYSCPKEKDCRVRTLRAGGIIIPQ